MSTDRVPDREESRSTSGASGESGGSGTDGTTGGSGTDGTTRGSGTAGESGTVGGSVAEGESGTADEPTDMAARVERLEAENERLRRTSERSRLRSYRRTAVGLAAVGAVAAAGGVLFPDSRTVLFALAGTGVFGAVLTYYVTPERFVPAQVGERAHLAFAATMNGLGNDLGLSETAVYVPSVPGEDPALANVRLFVPQRADYEVPDADRLEATLVVTGDERTRGVSISPTGAALVREYDGLSRRDRPETTTALLRGIADALEEGFELVDGVTFDVDEDRGRATVGVRGSLYGPVTRFDHPVASFVASGLATYLDRPVVLETSEGDDDGDRADYLVTCTWTTGPGEPT